jgi:small ligand-binding sensory domain FIST
MQQRGGRYPLLGYVARMKWASAISEHPVASSGIQEIVSRVTQDLAGSAPDLMIAFISPHHQASYALLPEALAKAFPKATLLGCSGNGVIGDGHEVEERPAISLTAASMPGVTITPFTEVRALEREPAAAVLLADPFTCDVQAMLSTLDQRYPRCRKVGGLASGARAAGGNALYLGGDIHRDGAVGVALDGDIVVDTLVAQGCRAIGKPMPVTSCQDNIILELDRKRPVDVLRDLHASLPNEDQVLMRHALHVGVEMNEGGMEFRAGEFLVRNLVGIDPESGAIAVGARMHPWQVVQFLLRDAKTAEHDLGAMLDRYRDAGNPRAAGALLFSCLGRGKHLFGQPDHDTGLFRDRLGAVPLGGFFCNGEIGPVGGTTFLHGYTSAFGLFRSKS